MRLTELLIILSGNALLAFLVVITWLMERPR